MTKKRRKSKVEEVQACKCPNCRTNAVKIAGKIFCESCDSIFVERKGGGANVLKIGVTQEKPQKQKRGFLSGLFK